MRIVCDITEYKSESPLAVAIGNFDGVHSGHRAVICAAVNSNYTTAVFTFDTPTKNTNLVSTISTKRRIIESLGVDVYICPDFEAIKNYTADEFVRLLQKMNVKSVFCGFNFKFGKGASADCNTLKSLGDKCGIDVTVTAPVTSDGTVISSSEIRKLLQNGEIDSANKFLTRPFEFDFKVTHGAHFGTDFMNTPTINQPWDSNITLPAFGVYASKTVIDGKVYKSITNIGIAPTVEYNEVRAETHIFDCNSMLYGETPTVMLCSFLRPERKFSSVDELKKQILADSQTVQNMDY